MEDNAYADDAWVISVQVWEQSLARGVETLNSREWKTLIPVYGEYDIR
jgi:hypothetical protein